MPRSPPGQLCLYSGGRASDEIFGPRAVTIRNVKVLGGYNTARAVASCRVLRGVVAWIYVLMLLNP